MGTSVSRSVDEGIGSDISNEQSAIRPGPPPLTAANAALPKSRSLDDGYQRKNASSADGSSVRLPYDWFQNRMKHNRWKIKFINLVNLFLHVGIRWLFRSNWHG